MAMDVVIAADCAYAVPLNACASSVIAHGPGCHLHVLDCGLSADDRRAVQATVGDADTVSFVTVPEDRLTGLPSAPCGSPATYARLFVDLVDQPERLLYLDADTIVRSSLQPLFDVDLGEATLAAVREMYTPTVSADNGILGWQGLGFRADDPYFNAGVMVVDSARWKARSIQARCLSYLRSAAPSLNLFDQEALNVALHGSWLELPVTWNVTRYWYKESRRVGAYANILERADIIHFISADKPWLGSDIVPPELSRHFFEALDRSSLAGWRPPGHAGRSGALALRQALRQTILGTTARLRDLLGPRTGDIGSAVVTRLLFVRHGETDHNVDKRICTHSDSARLSPKGVRQAADLARLLGAVQLASVYSSPMVRAVQTATVIGESLGLPVIGCDDLRELSAGELDGRSDPAAYDELNAALDGWCRGDVAIRIGAFGDVGSDVVERMANVMAIVAPRHVGQVVLLVSHGGLLQMTLPWLCSNLRPEYGLRRHIDNSAIIEVEWTDGVAHCVAWAGNRLTADFLPILD